MTAKLRKAVQEALAAQGGIIYPGVDLAVGRFIEQPKAPKDQNRPRTYQAIWAEKNRAGFKNLSVREYRSMMAVLELDEIII